MSFSSFCLLLRKELILHDELHYNKLATPDAYRKYIKTGYLNLEHQSSGYNLLKRTTLHSVFTGLTTLHNETINIYTHLLPSIIFIFITIYYKNINDYYLEMIQDIYGTIVAFGFFFILMVSFGKLSDAQLLSSFFIL